MSNVFHHSAEIRWFVQSLDQWQLILRWFRLQDQLPLNEPGQYDPHAVTGPSVTLEEERSDEYLLWPDCDTVGVKQREGKLEVKALVAGPRPFFQGDIVGRVDQWVKWSFEPSEKLFQDGRPFARQLERELDQTGPWCKVIKNRYLQKYSFDSGDPVAVSPNTWPAIGCNIELTKIEVRADISDWITLGFEAFGPSGRVMGMLDEAVKHFFSLHGPAPVQLDGHFSLSYPTWLGVLHCCP